MANNNVEENVDIIPAERSLTESTSPSKTAVNSEIIPTIKPNNTDIDLELFIK